MKILSRIKAIPAGSGPGLPSPRCRRGQSLVEMTLILPIMLLMFIGVLEVGWALRGYLTLLNASREAARFAARGRYVDFSTQAKAMVGYGYVLSQTQESLAGQMDVHFSGSNTNATLIITHYLIATRRPCASPPCNDSCADPPCDCSSPSKREPNDTTDDVIEGPDDGTHGYYRARFGLARDTAISPTQILADLKEENVSFNCKLNAADQTAPYSDNSVIIVEIFYDQPQLVGVPIISNRFTDPVPLYVITVMRISADARGSGKES
jgi:hypothetical protein